MDEHWYREYWLDGCWRTLTWLYHQHERWTIGRLFTTSCKTSRARTSRDDTNVESLTSRTLNIEGRHIHWTSPPQTFDSFCNRTLVINTNHSPSFITGCLPNCHMPRRRAPPMRRGELDWQRHLHSNWYMPCRRVPPMWRGGLNWQSASLPSISESTTYKTRWDITLIIDGSWNHI